MFEKYFIAPLLNLTKTILNYIGNPINPSANPNSLAGMLYELIRTRVIRYTLYSYTSNQQYSTNSTNYEVIRTFTITMPTNVTAYNYIFISVNFSHGAVAGASMWELGFGDNPTNWITLGEYITNSSTNYTEYYTLDPSVYVANNKINIRIKIKKTGSNVFNFSLAGVGYMDVQYT